MAQKEYHNYPIGTKIYPRDNSYQKLLETTTEWDGLDHSGDLYLQPCVIHSEEYKWNFLDEYCPVVNVLYNGGVYRVSISEYWDLTIEPTYFELIDDDPYFDNN